MLCYVSEVPFELFVIVAEGIQMMLDPETFYLNEKVTIQCSTSIKEYSGMDLVSTGWTTLPPQTTAAVELVKTTGCSYAQHQWLGTDNIWNQNLITAKDCATAAQTAPFTITFQPIVTEQLRGVDFWCVVNPFDKSTARTTVHEIKGELFSFTA